MLTYKPIVLISKDFGTLEYDLPKQSLWFCQFENRRKVATAHKSPDGRWLLHYGEISKSFDNLKECAKWLMNELEELICRHS